MIRLGGRKFVVAVFAIVCIAFLGIAKHPEVSTAIASVAVAFFAAHGAADWKNGKGDGPQPPA
jgi:hypothetical protein